ncbi:MAG: MFS transporter [Actinomycetia bacterium]|nr:MFS transporter [Actinomycetes bacterium]
MEEIRGRDLIRRGPFAKLWWANSVSSLGDWVNIFATLALAARIGGGGDGSTVAVIISLVARFLPGMLAGVVGGVVADRWNRKITMVVSDFGRAALVGTLLFVSNLSQLFLVIVLVEILGLFRQPAREAVVPTLIAPKHLAAANGLNLVSMYGTAPVGSALFALLTEFGEVLPEMGQFGAWVLTAFLFDMATFLVSGFITLRIPIKATPLPEQRRMKLERRSLAAPVRDLVEGWAQVGRRGPVRRLVWGMAVALLGGGGLFVMGQPFTQQVLDSTESGYGALLTSLGMGVAIGMVLLAGLGKKLIHREPIFALGLWAAGGGIIFTSFSRSVFAAVGWVLLLGVGTGMAYVAGFTQLHSEVTDEIRGRTFGALYTLGRLALLVSLAVAGVGAVALEGLLPGILGNGIRAVLFISGVAVLLTGLATLWAARSQLRMVFDPEAMAALRYTSQVLGMLRHRRSDKS